MGPIEKELRERFSAIRHEHQGRRAWVAMSWEAFRHLQEAAWRIRVNADSAYELDDHWRDIASEAIEAAEALGL